MSAKDDITQANTALAALKKYAQTKDGLFIQRRPVSENEFLGGEDAGPPSQTPRPDPTEEEIPEVPVQLKNNWFTKPLNMVTEMYSLPAYNNVDPNPLMAPFFILFYGIMMADMGYGLLMFLAGTNGCTGTRRCP